MQTLSHLDVVSKMKFIMKLVYVYFAYSPKIWHIEFIGLACQGKHIVFKFIRKYNSLRDFGL
jgi:hypothetical protein